MKNIAHSGCINFNISDHMPVFAIKKRLPVEKEFVQIKKRTVRNYNVDEFSQNLEELDWSILDEFEDVNIAWNMVLKGILLEVDILCPYQTFKVNKLRPVWYNSDICNHARDRDILNRNYRRTGCKNKLFYKRLVNKRKEFNRVVKETKKKFYIDQIEMYRQDQNKFWKMLGELTSTKSCQTIDRVFYPLWLLNVTVKKP